MLPTFYVMVFDTRVSSEQTVKQQEHILQGVAQMVMNMETEYVSLQLKPTLMSYGILGECFVFAESFPAKNKMLRLTLCSLFESQSS